MNEVEVKVLKILIISLIIANIFMVKEFFGLSNIRWCYKLEYLSEISSFVLVLDCLIGMYFLFLII